MDPVLADEPMMAELVTMAKKKNSEFQLVKKYLEKYPDLLHGTNFPETDVDVVIGLIMRFLHDNVLQKVLYGAVAPLVSHVNLIESSMQTNVEPKRGRRQSRFL